MPPAGLDLGAPLAAGESREEVGVEEPARRSRGLGMRVQDEFTVERRRPARADGQGSYCGVCAVAVRCR